MKAIIHLPKVTIEVEAPTQVELFDAIAGATEVFGEEKCAGCQSTAIRPVARKVSKGKQTYTFREMHCNACFERLSYGQNLEGDTLFPKRKLDAQGRPDGENGQYGKHNGWTKFKGDKEDAPSEQPPTQAQPTAVKGRR